MKLILLGLFFPLLASAADISLISISDAKGMLKTGKYIHVIQGGLHKDPDSGVITEYSRINSTLSAYDPKTQQSTSLYVAGNYFAVVEGLCVMDSIHPDGLSSISGYCITR